MKKLTLILVNGLFINFAYLTNTYADEVAVPLPLQKPTIGTKQKINKAGIHDFRQSAKEIIAKEANSIERDCNRKLPNSSCLELNSKNTSSLIKAFEQALSVDSIYLSAKQEPLYAFSKLKAITAETWGPKVDFNFSSTYGYGLNTVFPTEPGIGKQVTNTSGFNNSWGITLQQPILNFPQMVENEKAEVKIELSDLFVNSVYQEFIVRFVSTYLNIVKAQEILRIREDSLSQYIEHGEVIEKLYETGQEALDALTQAQSQIKNAESEKSKAQEFLYNESNVLKNTWEIDSRNLKKFIKNSIEYPVPVPNSFEKWGNGIRENNLTIKYSKVLVEIASLDVEKERKYLWYPVVSAILGYTNTNISSNPMGSPGITNESLNVGIFFKIPLIDSGRARHNTNAAEEKRIQALHDLRTIIISAQNAGISAFSAVSLGSGRVSSLKNAVQLAYETLEGQKQQFQFANPKVTSFNLLSSVLNLNNARISFLNEKYNYLINRLKLKQAIGSLSIQDIIELDHYLSDDPKDNEMQ